MKLGIRTGNNPVFLMTEEGLEQLGVSEPELGLFRPVAGNDTIRGGVIRGGERVFYPYGEDGQPLFNDEVELARAAPNYYEKVLKPNRQALSGRQSLRNRQWWELVEPRTTWLATPQSKLVSAYFAGSGQFAYDVAGEFAVLQGFGWLWKGAQFHGTDLPFAYLALLNSPVFQVVLGLYCPRVQSGQFDLSPRFVNSVFLPDLADEKQSVVVATLAGLGRRIMRGEPIDAETLDRSSAAAYGIPLEAFRGEGAAPSATEQRTEDLEAKFQTLAERWRRETGMLSSMSKQLRHPAYLEIIALGPPAIPLILKELRDRPDHWFEALRAICGMSPVQASERADPRRVRAAWLSWGRQHGHIE